MDMTHIASVTTFKVLFVTFLASYSKLLDYVSIIQETAHLNVQRSQSNTPEHFDYIIVGGGVAGCVLANRLSANSSIQVLLIERGGDPNPLTSVPLFSTQNLLSGSKKLAYMHWTTKQENACFSSGGSCYLSTGRGLGGSSNINALVNTRGSPEIYDIWANITKDAAWSFDNVLPFFKKSEDYHGYHKSNADPKFRSTGGEWYVGNTDGGDNSPAWRYFFDSAKANGYSFIDQNSGDSARKGGYGYFDWNVKDGERWSAYKAFLESVLKRDNLRVIRYGRAVKLIMDKNEKAATGVQYIRDGTLHDVFAKREVILSAGVFGSAELLMRSGIGPIEYLKSIGIPAYHNLPVGENLMDHCYATLSFSINKTIFFYPERDTKAMDIFKYVTSKTGYYAKVLAESAFLVTKSKKAKSLNSVPDIELIYGTPLATKLPSTEPGIDYFGVLSMVTSPQSVGTFKLKSMDLDDKYLINPNYLSNPNDAKILIDGLQLGMKLIMDSPDFQKLGVKYIPHPDCSKFIVDTLEYWTCFVKSASSSGFHPVGTCRMGSDASDNKAVVDSKLKVLGIAGLRVVDASVFPLIPNGHTTCPTVMTAEIASTFIIQNQN